MKRKIFIGIMMMVFVMGILITVSCTKKTVMSEPSVSKSEKIRPAVVATQTVEANHKEVKDSGSSSIEPRIPEEKRIKAEQRHQPEDTQRFEKAGRRTFLNELVLFDFDSSILTAAAQDRLRLKAQWLTDNPDVSFIIQGHCDERGTGTYNLALGERRVQAAKAFLMDLGISAGRFSTVSYGEERSFAAGHNEGAWRLNRRAHFVIE